MSSEIASLLNEWKQINLVNVSNKRLTYLSPRREEEIPKGHRSKVLNIELESRDQSALWTWLKMGCNVKKRGEMGQLKFSVMPD
jgi:hypothetical protein